MTTCTHGTPTEEFCKQCEMEQDLALSAAGSMELKDWMEKPLPLPEVEGEKSNIEVAWDPNFETVDKFQVPPIWREEEE